MKLVEPQVFLIGQTKINWPGINDWLRSLGGEESLKHVAGDDAEILIEEAARRCYLSFDVGLNPNVTKVRHKSLAYHENILQQAHGSVMAHAWATWAFENVSRVFTHELVRNALGVKDNDANEDLRAVDFAYSQESLRYVRLNSLKFWFPKDISDDEAVLTLLLESIESSERLQSLLAKHFDLDHKDFETKKRITSALRRVVPMGIATGIVWTVNMRALRWIIEQRTATAAEEEFRLVFDKVAHIAKETWGQLFQDFERNADGEWVPKYRKV